MNDTGNHTQKTNIVFTRLEKGTLKGPVSRERKGWPGSNGIIHLKNSPFQLVCDHQNLIHTLARKVKSQTKE
jgi:hypothetical protein